MGQSGKDIGECIWNRGLERKENLDNGRRNELEDKAPEARKGNKKTKAK